LAKPPIPRILRHLRPHPARELLPRAADADILLTNKMELTAGTIQNLPRLKYIGVLATGTNVVDLAAARARGIPVTNVPTYGTKSVAQMTFALLLELAQHAGHHAQTVREGAGRAVWSGATGISRSSNWMDSPSAS